MTLTATHLAALARHAEEVQPQAPLAPLTWWRVGGPADALVTAHSTHQLTATLALAADLGLPVVVLGKGSNVLIHDDGVEGIVLRLAGDLTSSSLRGDQATAGAGLANAAWMRRLDKEGRQGLACLAGIPGTVGGAVAMNAGSSLGSLGDVLVEVEVAGPHGRIDTLPAESLSLGYRACTLPPGAIVARATIRCVPDPGEADRVRAFLARRKATQPLNKRSCGSTFTNPPSDAAGRLIEAAGLKGARIGDAVVSEQHANFLLNEGQARAADLWALVTHIQDEVERIHGVRLTPEVRRLGRW